MEQSVNQLSLGQSKPGGGGGGGKATSIDDLAKRKPGRAATWTNS